MRNITRQQRLLKAALGVFDENDPRKAFTSVMQYGYNVTTKLNDIEKKTAKKILHALNEYINLVTTLNNYLNDKENFVVNRFNNVALKMTKEDFKKRLAELYQFDFPTNEAKQKNLFLFLLDITNNLEIDYYTVSAVDLKIKPFSALQENSFANFFPNYEKQDEQTFMA